jgi:hypothetical protein
MKVVEERREVDFKAEESELDFNIALSTHRC